MPENENNQSPKKKRGFLWVIIIILMVVLAAVIGGYALCQYYGTPAWLSGILPGNEVSAPAPVEETVEPLSIAPPAPVKTSPVPTQTPQASDVEEPKESTQPETPVATAVPTPAVTATPTIGADAAAEAALKHSKVNEKDADVNSVLLVEQNGMMLYEVCFSTKDNQYEYLLDASTGRVESWRKAAIADTVTEAAVAASGELKPTASPEPTAAGLAGRRTAAGVAAAVGRSFYFLCAEDIFAEGGAGFALNFNFNLVIEVYLAVVNYKL